MSNSNNSEPRTRITPKNTRALYEFETNDGGVVIIKAEIVSREDLLVAGKVKGGPVLKGRAAD